MKNTSLKRYSYWVYALFLLLFVGMFVWKYWTTNTSRFYTDEGFVFGTTYHITYKAPSPLTNEIIEELQKFDASLSTFNKNSIISRINRNEDSVKIDEWFRRVFEKSMEVSEQTQGAFDITVAPLVNAWGFGFKKKAQVTQALIDSLLPFVGYKKVHLEGEKVVKEYPQTMLDCSAIAKGFACDVIGDLLLRNEMKDFMVEIGGEVFCKGRNAKGDEWRIGISNPVELGKEGGELQNIHQIVSFTNKGMATSGNYRNFYYEGGKRYAHTINPKTGYPVQHQLLSATVIAPDCMTADAYATAFMVLGVEKAMKIVEEIPELEAYFISSSQEGEGFDVSYSEGIKRMLK